MCCFPSHSPPETFQALAFGRTNGNPDKVHYLIPTRELRRIGDLNKSTLALYQHSGQPNNETTVTDRFRLHPDGSYDQQKRIDEGTNADAVIQNAGLNWLENAAFSALNPCAEDADRWHGNPPRDAGVEAWKNPKSYWDKFKPQQPASGTFYNSKGQNRTTSSGAWRLLDKSNGAVLAPPKSVMDLPPNSVVELSQAMPLGVLDKTWTKTVLVVPAKEFDYSHS